MATLLLAAVAGTAAVQSVAVSTSAALLAVNGVWAVTPLCVAALSTLLGFAAAQQRAGATARAFLLDRLRGPGSLFLVVVLATAYGLGPFITNRGVRAYLTDPATLAYLLNLLGVPQFELPGVFEFNDLSAIVNVNVWPAPFAMAVVALCCVPVWNRWMRHAPIMLAAALAAGVVVAQSLDILPATGSGLATLALRGDGLSALLGAMLGIAAYHARARIALRKTWALGAAAALALAVLIGNAAWPAVPAFRVGIAVPLGYLVLYLSCVPLPLSGVAQAARPYLWGVFLMSFPLQQLAIERGPRNQTFLVNFAIAIPATLAVAVAWWWLIGRRLLSTRQRLELAEGGQAVAGTLSGRGHGRGRTRGWEWWRQRVGESIPSLVVAAVIALLAMGVLAMLYVASLPEADGI